MNFQYNYVLHILESIKFQYHIRELLANFSKGMPLFLGVVNTH